MADLWGQKAADHMHFDDGFSIVAEIDDRPVGLISVYWRKLPPPIEDAFEGYIDIIDVLAGFRRRGIASHLVELASHRAGEKGAFQLRAWSSEDKTEAIPMWRALGFGLCPATIYPGGQEVRGYFVTKSL
jgi:GNAT superfamily N-acetyltransferase